MKNSNFSISGKTERVFEEFFLQKRSEQRSLPEMQLLSPQYFDISYETFEEGSLFDIPFYHKRCPLTFLWSKNFHYGY